MRLEHRQHAFSPAAGRSRCLKGGANFGGMMRVIIDQQKSIAGVLYFKPAPGVFEFEKRSCNFLEGNSKLIRQRDYTNSIVDIVLSGNIQPCFAQSFAPTINAK